MKFNLLRAWTGTCEEQPSLNGREISDDELTAVVGGHGQPEGEEENENIRTHNRFRELRGLGDEIVDPLFRGLFEIR